MNEPRPTGMGGAQCIPPPGVYRFAGPLGKMHAPGVRRKCAGSAPEAHREWAGSGRGGPGRASASGGDLPGKVSRMIRDDLSLIPSYVPGKTEAGSLKLASNEMTQGPLP